MRTLHFLLSSLQPIQMPNMDMSEIFDGKKQFTKNEWIDVLMRSTGMEPTQLEERVKWHLLLRLVPLVENNYNMCELGPRGTGKSHVYKEISPNSILVSGGHCSHFLKRRRTIKYFLTTCYTCVKNHKDVGEMSVDREELKNMIDRIPEQDALELFKYLDYLNMKREKEYFTQTDVNLLSEDSSLIEQIKNSRDDRAAGRVFSREEGLEYLHRKSDRNNG